MEDLINELLEELKIELEVVEESDIQILSIKLKNAIREIKLARGYDTSFGEDFILNDIQKYVSNIKDLTMYDYVHIGMEGENNHDENGIGRTWRNRKSCFDGIVKFCNVY